MKKIHATLLFLTVSLGSIYFLHTSETKKSESLIYLHERITDSNSQEDVFNSLISKKNSVVVFYKDRCGACKNTTPIMESLATTFPRRKAIIGFPIFHFQFSIFALPSNLGFVPKSLFGGDYHGKNLTSGAAIGSGKNESHATYMKANYPILFDFRENMIVLDLNGTPVRTYDRVRLRYDTGLYSTIANQRDSWSADFKSFTTTWLASH